MNLDVSKIKELIEKIDNIDEDNFEQISLQNQLEEKLEFHALRDIKLTLEDYPFYKLEKKIRSVLSKNNINVSSTQVIDLPSIEGPDLVFKIKENFEENKTNFSNIKEFAQKIYEILQELEEFEEVELQGIFINFYFRTEFYKNLLKDIYETPDYGKINYLDWEKICIDYSSPNLGKQMTVWHFRTTVIGQAISNLCESLWARVFRWNFLGDWGTNFGKMVYSLVYHYHNNINSSYYGEKLLENISDNPSKTLGDLYSNFSNIPEDEKKDKARKYFNLLESWHPLMYEFFYEFKRLTLLDFKETYQRLGNNFDTFIWESFAHTLTSEVIQEIQQMGYLWYENNAWLVKFRQQNNWKKVSYQPLKTDEQIDEDNDKIEVFLVQKSDGAKLYWTRDLAMLKYRYFELWADKLYYVVWPEQKLHFSLLFSLANVLWEIPMENMQHISYGMLLVGWEKMASRWGNFYSLNDLLDWVKEKLQETSTLDEQLIEKVTVNSVLFNDLKNDIDKDVEFDIENMTKLNWDTWVYVTYTYTRIKSLISQLEDVKKTELNPEHLTANQKEILLKIFYLPSLMLRCYNFSKPHFLAQAVLGICHDFNSFYSNSEKIINMDNQKKYTNYVFLQSVVKFFDNFFDVVNMAKIERM